MNDCNPSPGAGAPDHDQELVDILKDPIVTYAAKHGLSVCEVTERLVAAWKKEYHCHE